MTADEIVARYKKEILTAIAKGNVEEARMYANHVTNTKLRKELHALIDQELISRKN